MGSERQVGLTSYIPSIPKAMVLRTTQENSKGGMEACSTVLPSLWYINCMGMTGRLHRSGFNLRDQRPCLIQSRHWESHEPVERDQYHPWSCLKRTRPPNTEGWRRMQRVQAFHERRERRMYVVPAVTSPEGSMPSRESWTPEAKADFQGDEHKAPDSREPPRRSNTHVGPRTVPGMRTQQPQ